MFKEPDVDKSSAKRRRSIREVYTKLMNNRLNKSRSRSHYSALWVISSG